MTWFIIAGVCASAAIVIALYLKAKAAIVRAAQRALWR